MYFPVNLEIVNRRKLHIFSLKQKIRIGSQNPCMHLIMFKVWGIEQLDDLPPLSKKILVISLNAGLIIDIKSVWFILRQHSKK